MNKEPVPPINIYASGPVSCSVCAEADLSSEEVERMVNRLMPTGIDSPWRISDESFKDGTPNGVECHDGPTRKHYLLVC